MVTRFFRLIVPAAFVLWAVPAAAQTPPPPPATPASPKPAALSSTSPVVNLFYGGILTGAAAVKNTGSVVGAEAGGRVWRNLDVFAEGGSFGDVVTARQIDVATPLTSWLQTTQGKQASANVKMPALYGGVGGRWVFENVRIGGWARPYALAAVGGARVKREPTFMLAGSDITSTLSQYGVTLGGDLTDTEKHAAFTAGAGVVVPVRMLYVDVGYRVTSIRFNDPININRFNFGVGARF